MWVVNKPEVAFVVLPAQPLPAVLGALLAGPPHPPQEGGLLAEPLHEGTDLRAPAVDDDRPDAHEAQQDHVEREGLLEVRALHGGPPVLDDHRLAAELPDVRERLQEYLDPPRVRRHRMRSEEHTSELQSQS